jgi:hypothetical protein
MMSSSCFKTECSSSGRQLYIQVWYSVLYMHQYKLSLPNDEPLGLKYAEGLIN